MRIEFLNPAYEISQQSLQRAPRLASAAGAVIAIMSNNKKGTRPFFDAMDKVLRQRYQVAEVVRLSKSNYSAPAETALMNGAERWSAMIAGIGD